jgi:hypothetical protein
MLFHSNSNFAKHSNAAFFPVAKYRASYYNNQEFDVWRLASNTYLICLSFDTTWSGP